MGKHELRTAASLQLNEPSEVEHQRTYVVFGTRRGGTSAAAGVLRALGLHLGDVGARKTNEDPAFQNRPPKQLREAVEQRNAERDVWGWKFAGAGPYLPDLLETMRNPYFVIVFRDPVATALSQARLDRPGGRRTTAVALHESNANLNTNMGLALSSDRPCLLISNEKALQNRESLIDELADFLQVPRPDGDFRARIVEYLSPGRYKSFDDFFGPDADVPATPERRVGPMQRLKRRKP